jgi:archaellum component FlaF (FlaF/FlaG flagellin family)
MTNVTGVKISNPYAGVPAKFSANTSTDVYYKSLTNLSFKWKVEYANGTVAPQGATTYTVVSGNLNNSTWVVIQFNTLNNMILSLSAKNPSNVTGYSNLTLTMLVSTPRIVVTSAYVVGTPTEGSAATIWINFTNKGQATAYDVNLTVLVNGNAVATFQWPILNVSQVQNQSFTWTPRTSGTLTVQVTGSTGNEPSFYATLGSFTTSVSVNPAPYKTTLVIVVIVVVIVAVGIVYYRLTTGGRRKKSETEEKKPSLIEQKKLEKKK